MSIWVMVFIGGLLCIQIANPFFWYRIAKSVSVYNHAMQEFRKKPDACNKPTYRNYLENEEIGDIKSGVIGNIVCFVVCSVLLWIMFYFAASDRTFSMLFATSWFFAIGNVISTFITFAEARTFKAIEYLQAWAYAIAMLVIFIALLIHGGAYNFINHVNANTFLTEEKVHVISTDVTNTLEKTVLIQGYTLGNPINRDGKVIYPLSRSDSDNVSIAGYVELGTNGTPIIVLKDLHYTPYQRGSQNIRYVARDYLPTKQFFGTWSFQLSPEGDVYFAEMYGKFASLRGGRIIEGLLLINATTGECSNYPLSEVPNWINGISE